MIRNSRYYVLTTGEQEESTSDKENSVTITKLDNACQTENTDLYAAPDLHFRGPRDPLSPFYPFPVKYKKITFQTAEHCYHHEKATFHGNRQAARDIFHAPTPREVKRTANKWFPRCSPRWNEVKFRIMEVICFVNTSQCSAFRNKLLGRIS